MGDEGKLKPVKDEEGGENGTKAKPAIKEEPIGAPDDDDDDDNVPLALSKGKKKKKPGNPSSVKKEEINGEEDYKSPKGKTAKKEAGMSNGELSTVKKEEPQEKKTDKKKETAMSNGKPLKVKRKETQDSSSEEERSDKGKKQKKEAAKSNGKLSKVKKEEVSDSEEEQAEKDKKKKKKKKKEVEKKVVVKARKDAAVPGKEKKEKKVYNLPGQKHDPPEERDPLRIFYETLYEKVPTSEMAAFWMMEWGLLPPEVAKKVYEKKMKKSHLQKLGSPVKVVSVKKTATATVKKVKISLEAVPKTPKKRKASGSDDDEDEDDDDDFVLSKKIKKQKVSR